MDTVAGTMFTETTTAGVTVKPAEPFRDPEDAVMVAEPSALATTDPDEPTLAMVAEEELHVTSWVKFCVLPSEKFPVAVSCWASPTGEDDWEGLTVIPTNTAFPTVREAEPAMEPEVAVMVVVPSALPRTEPEAATLATPVPDEAQVTEFVIFSVDPSEKFPLAVSCSDSPTGTDDGLGVTVMPSKAAWPTDTEAVPFTDPEVAVMVAVPIAAARTEPVGPTVAMPVPEELQVAD